MKDLRFSILAMTLLVIISNYLVLFPINDWLTYAAFTYPITYLVTELTNRFYGKSRARKVVYIGFIIGVILSIWLSNFKIALASGSAFLVSQLADILIFSKIRQSNWWVAPITASCIASIIDSAIFWSIAFWGESVPLLSWALGDTAVKLAIDLAMLTPFRIAIRKTSIIRTN